MDFLDLDIPPPDIPPPPTFSPRHFPPDNFTQTFPHGHFPRRHPLHITTFLQISSKFPSSRVSAYLICNYIILYY